MQHKSVILDVSVEHQGQIHTASYFVEGDLVHARIGDNVLLSPLGGADAADKVRHLLLAHLAAEARQAEQAATWRPEQA